MRHLGSILRGKLAILSWGLVFLCATEAQAQCPGTSCTDGDYVSLTTGEWTVGADWCVCSSGSYGIATLPPGSTNDVTIRNGHVMTIAIGITANCRDMTIDAGGQVTMEVDVLNANSMNIYGDWTNNGTLFLDILNISVPGLLDGAAVVTFTGDTKHDMQSNGTDGANEELFNVSIDNDDTLELLDIVASNKLILQNDLSFSSGATHTGYVILNDNDLEVAKDVRNASTISGTNETKFIVTNSTGGLKIDDVGSGTDSVIFPIGHTIDTFSPVSISNSGTADDFTVRCCREIHTGATCGSTNIANRAVRITWFISEASAGGSSANLTFRWNNEDELPHPFDIWYLNHHDGSSWSFASGEGGKTGTQVGGDTYIASSSNSLSDFSPWAWSSEGVLPVRLVRFYGEVNALPELRWDVHSESNLDEYLIERSSDGTGWELLDRVPALNDGQPHAYSWKDMSPLQGKAYYRLRMTEFDGGEEWSDAILLETPMDLWYPIIDGNALQIHGIPDQTQVWIFDIHGRRLNTSFLEPGGQIDVSNLVPGWYVLHLGHSGQATTFFRQ